MLMFFICVVIVVVVFGVMFVFMYLYCKFCGVKLVNFYENVKVEIVWIIVFFFIFIFMVVFVVKILIVMEDISEVDLIVVVIGF